MAMALFMVGAMPLFEVGAIALLMVVVDVESGFIVDINDKGVLLGKVNIWQLKLFNVL